MFATRKSSTYVEWDFMCYLYGFLPSTRLANANVMLYFLKVLCLRSHLLCTDHVEVEHIMIFRKSYSRLNAFWRICNALFLFFRVLSTNVNVMSTVWTYDLCLQSWAIIIIYLCAIVVWCLYIISWRSDPFYNICKKNKTNIVKKVYLLRLAIFGNKMLTEKCIHNYV